MPDVDWDPAYLLILFKLQTSLSLICSPTGKLDLQTSVRENTYQIVYLRLLRFYMNICMMQKLL